jgi:DNA repair exonuclease SbcCD ATPase subunit
MILTELEIIRMPGFEENGFALSDISSGLNIIIGPNGSGKTTTCHAIQGLLWPEKLASIKYPKVKSIWKKDQQKLLIEITGKDEPIYQLDGQPTTAPNLPKAYLADCYIVSIDDLFEGTQETDSELANQVSLEMIGGFDLNSLKIRNSPQKARNAAKELQKVKEEVSALENKYRSLKIEENELDALEREYKSAKKSRKTDGINTASS